MAPDFASMSISQLISECLEKKEDLDKAYTSELPKYKILLNATPDTVKMAVETIIREKIKLKLDVREKNQYLTLLKSQNKTLNKKYIMFKAILGFRERCEMFETVFYPANRITEVNNRQLKWKLLLEVGTHHVVQHLRQQIQCSEVSVIDFAKIVSNLYESYPKRDSVPFIKPETLNPDELVAALDQNSLLLDRSEYIALRVLFKSVDIEGNARIVDPFKFIRMYGVIADHDAEEKIRQFFQSSGSIVDISKETEGVYLVKFTCEEEAIHSLVSNETTIENWEVRLALTNKTTEVFK